MNGAVKARKHEAILSGATRVFVREGFDGTSMEQVAREAKVAKPTLYNHFPNKGALYVATVENALGSARDEIAEPRLAELSARQGLLEIANQLTYLFGRHDSVVHLCRIAVGAFERFPLATSAIMDAGPRRGTEKIKVLLRVWCGRGELTVKDGEIAAQQLVELCKVSIFDRRLFGSPEKVPVAQCERVARAAYDTFMARYGA
jgi:AcrR family transcriptional regulator